MDALDSILLPQHLADLRRSGLSDEQIRRCGFRSSSDAEQIGRWLRWQKPAKVLGPCLVIPFAGADAKFLEYVRVKPDRPRTARGKGGKPIKYESPVGAPNRAYFPPATRAALRDTSTPMIITEGEKKAAKADQEGFACIGLVGVYGFQKARPKDADGKGQGPRELIADLAAVAWRGRKVLIAFDSDLTEKPGVRWAEFHLAETLQHTGAEVLAVRIPAGADGSKQGLDDYLTAAGPDALRDLLAIAKTVERPDEESQPLDAPEDPHRLAGLYLDWLRGRGPLTLRFWRGEFVEWKAGAYSALPDTDVKARLTAFIRDEFRRLNFIEQEAAREKDSPPRTRTVTTRLLADVANALRSLCLLPATISAPAWLDDAKGPDPFTLLSTKVGILDVAAFAAGKPGSLMPPTPTFFTFNALPFAFEPKASTPRQWLGFLRQLWQGDPESIDALQEWFGYLLTPDTRLQKILFLLGPRRAGKGTIARILKEVVGAANVAGPTLNSLTTNFGLSPLLDKPVAIVDDARLSHRSDAAIITERLLTISGEGTITVDRKFLSPVNTKLPTRLVIISNEIPRLGDASGALAGRLILLRFTETFFGREDHHLTDRLLSELPGILLWAIAGWKRLQSRGCFVQPTTGAPLIREMEDLSSPVGAFVREECIVDRAAAVPVGDLYRAWTRWCEDHGRKEPGTEQTFGRDLRAAVPYLDGRRPNQGGERWREYVGIRIRSGDEPPQCEPMPSDANCSGSGPYGPRVRGPSNCTHGRLNSEQADNEMKSTIDRTADHADQSGPSDPPADRLFPDWRNSMPPD